LRTSLVSLLCILCATGAEAALRIGNSGTGRGGTYATVQGAEIVAQQQAELQHVLETAQTSTELGLPVRVTNMDMARAIARGQSYQGISMANLESCAAIFPTGSWSWDKANAGMKSSTGCVAEVELRKVEGTADIILARARVAAGSSIDCNIDSFPADGLTMDAGKVMFPADREPTLEEVKQALNQEQKQGAGMKIAAAALLGGIGGNFIGQNDPGKGGMIGTSGDKMKKTAIGAVALGGLTAVSTQAGKVGGDVIMGATVNAIGGGLIGNISGIGNPVLLVKKCEGYDCLYGIVAENDTLKSDYKAFFNLTGSTIKCNSTPDKDGNFENCGAEAFSAFEFYPSGNLKDVNKESKPEDQELVMRNQEKQYCYAGGTMTLQNGLGNCDGAGTYVELRSATLMTNAQPAVIVDWDSKKSKFDDFKKWRATGPKNVDIRFRYSDGTIGREAMCGNERCTAKNFQPVTQAATDGGIIDLNNKARMGATATGAGVGAGLGAFSSFQGAKDEVENRHVAAVTEYKDSLTKFYCATGNRFLSQYNETAIIPSEQ